MMELVIHDVIADRLAEIASAQDDPVSLVQAARMTTDSLREFLSVAGLEDDPDARKLLDVAAISDLQDESKGGEQGGGLVTVSVSLPDWLAGELDEAYVPPSPELAAERFLTELAQTRAIAVVGRRGTGKTAFLKSLARFCNQKSRHDGSTPRILPVFMSLATLAGGDVAQELLTTVHRHTLALGTQLNDETATHSRFVFLLDDFDQLEDAVQHDVLSFIEENLQRHWICVSATRPEMIPPGIARYQLPALSEHQAQMLLFSRLGKPMADQFLALIQDEQTTEVMRRPALLLVASTMFKTYGTLPETLSDIPNQLISPIEHSWQKGDRSDIFAQLLVFAFRSRAVGSNESVQLPGQAVEELVKWGVVARRHGLFVFGEYPILDSLASQFLAHTAVRPFLGQNPLHVTRRWTNLLEYMLVHADDSQTTRALIQNVAAERLDIVQSAVSSAVEERPDLVNWIGMDVLTRIGKSP